jgi:hypothetical protein
MAESYCGISGAPVDLLLERLTDIGLTPTDIRHLEYLSDQTVLQHLEGGFRWLRRNRRDDAIAYFEAFANMLENRLLDAALRDNLAEIEQETLAVV